MADIVVSCKGCGRPIFFASVGGKIVPLDVRAPVYFLAASTGEAVRVNTTAGVKEGQEVRPGHYVTHFATCPKANEFTGKGKK